MTREDLIYGSNRNLLGSDDANLPGLIVPALNAEWKAAKASHKVLNAVDTEVPADCE